MGTIMVFPESKDLIDDAGEGRITATGVVYGTP